MSPDWWRDCRDGIEKYSSPTGDGKGFHVPSKFRHNPLRNIVPRQGTESGSIIFLNLFILLRNIVPRQGTESWFPPNLIVMFVDN